MNIVKGCRTWETPVGYIPGKTIRGDFDLLGHSVSREGVVYVEFAYNRCNFFVPGLEVGGTRALISCMGGCYMVDESRPNPNPPKQPLDACGSVVTSLKIA